MLDINVNVEVKEKKYAITFTDNTCSKCGAKDTLRFIDIFGRDVKQEIHPLERIKCRKCGAEYGINWIPKDNSFVPVPTNNNPGLMLNNLINYKRIKRNGNNQL